MSILDNLIKFLLRLLTKLLRLSNFGSGTALPGKLIENLYPNFLKKLASEYNEVVFVTGTNGKTSVASMISNLYREAGYYVTANKEGSNMIRGIISTLVNSPNPNFHKNVLVLEVEEATMPKLAKYITPNYIIITNVFRDQLDAYGEITRVISFIRNAIEISPDSVVLYNSNDPLVLEIISKIQNIKYSYSLTPEFNEKFKYEKEIVQTANHEVKKNLVEFLNSIDHVFSQTVVVNVNNEAIQYELNLTGIYNILNSLAAFTLGQVKGFEIEKIISALEKTDPSFGRGEKIIIPQIPGRNFKQIEVRLFLAKNPAGYEQILEILKNEPKSFTAPTSKYIFILNDNVADGRDVSWIWDIDFFKSNLKLPSCICSGNRAEDMALRLKYAEVSKTYVVTPDIGELIEDIINAPAKYRVVCTYTGMIEFRKYLRKYTNIKALQ